MSESDISVFIEGVYRYFETVSDKKASVDIPFLQPSEELLEYDYTGMISISGKEKGCVYFTAPKAMLGHLLLTMGEQSTSSNLILDLVGEIANIISGNARAYFGQDFMISVPLVIERDVDQIPIAASSRSFVIPVRWNGYKSGLVIFAN